MTRSLLLALACLALPACAGLDEHDGDPGERDVREVRRHRDGPGDDEVGSAVRDLAQRLEEEGVPPWPPHLPRSRDFPELPLVRVAEVEDLGRVGADVEGLTRALEHEVRRQRRLRLASDEEAVPPSLRAEGPGAPPADDGAEPDPRKPGLLLRAWTDEEGRLRLALEDLVTGQRLVRARSYRQR